MYCVVSTLKRRAGDIVKEFSLFPEIWVENNVLYWPKNNLITYMKNMRAPDKIQWEKCKCEVHKKKITSYEEGLMWEEKLTQINTEDEEK